MSAVIHVDRQAGGYTDRARAYKLLVDGEERGTVKHGEGLDAEVAAGAHTLQMKVDWATSPEQKVTVSEGGRAEFQCAPNASPLTAIFYALFRRSNYIRLEPASPGGSGSVE
jgi:hypothetical protein